jgi:uncharacterized damage-inducible protein DinB
MNEENQHIGRIYLDYSRKRLLTEFLPRMERCLNELTEEQVWWRAHETDNAIGNLILHLSGNIRQWIISGLGGAEDKRVRSEEFAERKHIPKAELSAKIRSTIEEADKVLERYDVSRLLEVQHIQRWDTTPLDAVSHVVEHVAQHLGQIIYITKLQKGIDLKFYDL